MINIVVAEDQQMLLTTLVSLLNLEENIEVVGKAGNGIEAMSLVQQHQPDLCIMDLEMPLKTGLDVAEELKTYDCKTIILTTFARPGYFERVQKAEVEGFLLKDSPSEELINSIHYIMAGGRIYAPELVDDKSVSTQPFLARSIR